MEYMPSSAAVWSLFSWLGLAYLQFFILQFIADTRSRDLIAQRVNRQFTPSYYVQSIMQFIVLFLWAVAAWATWLQGAWVTHTSTLVFYVVLLALEIFAWFVLWTVYAGRAASAIMALNACIAFIVMFYAFSLTGSTVALVPYALWQVVQAVNFFRFTKYNMGVKFPKRAFGRLRESSVRINANVFLSTVQDPSEHIIETVEVLDGIIVDADSHRPATSTPTGHDTRFEIDDFNADFSYSD